MPTKDFNEQLKQELRGMRTQYRAAVNGGRPDGAADANEEAHRAAAEAALRLEGIMANDPYLQQRRPAATMQSMQTAWQSIKDYRDDTDGDHYQTAREKLKEAMQSAKGLNRLSIDMGLQEINTLLADHPPAAGEKTRQEGFTISQKDFAPHVDGLRAAAMPEIKARAEAAALEGGLRSALNLPPVEPQGGTFLRPAANPLQRPHYAPDHNETKRRFENTAHAAEAALDAFDRLPINDLPENLMNKTRAAREIVTMLKETPDSRHYNAAQSAITEARNAARKSGNDDMLNALGEIQKEMSQHAPPQDSANYRHVDNRNSGQLSAPNPKKHKPSPDGQSR